MSAKRYINEIENHYNPDKDLCASAAGCPPVHYNTWALMQVVKEQQERIEKLERRLEALVNYQRNCNFEGV